MSTEFDDLRAVQQASETVDDEADQDSDSAVVPLQYDISSYGADYDVEGLVKRLNRGDILIPSFQRNYVWNQQEASRFIESLLLGLPVPGVFMARERDSNKLLVIDGQQRLKTLQFFYNGYFNPQENEDTRRIFKLVKVNLAFEGQTYEELKPEDKVRLNDSIIHTIVIKQETPADEDTSIYHVFDRLNSYGRRLTPQEIRTALDHGPLIELLKTLNDHAGWRAVYGTRNPTLKDQELILRFFALYFDGGSYEAPMNEFLNKFSAKYRKADQAFLDRCAVLFIGSIDSIVGSVGERAFRLVRTINAAVFDSVMVGLARRLDRTPSPSTDAIKSAYEDLLADEEYQRLVSRATANERNLEARISLASSAFADI